MEIGQKIKSLRLENSLTQDELASRCELTKGFISQVERDITSPSIATLIDILESLGTTLQEFFQDTPEEKIVFSPADIFETENVDLKYKLEWLIPNAQKNDMEPILINIEAGGSFLEDDPHIGEEFGYVLSGIISVNLGKKKYKAKKGDSFYYKCNVRHSITNTGKTVAKVLLISSPPNF